MRGIFGSFDKPVESEKQEKQERTVPVQLPDLAKDIYDGTIRRVHLSQAAAAPPGTASGTLPESAADQKAKDAQSKRTPPETSGSIDTDSNSSHFAPAKSDDTDKALGSINEDILSFSRPKEPAPLHHEEASGSGSQRHHAGMGLHFPLHLFSHSRHPSQPPHFSSSHDLHESNGRGSQEDMAPDPEDAADISFFGSLQNALSTGDFSLIERELLERNPMDELKEFHKARTGEKFISQEYAQRRLLVLLGELRRLEEEWAFANRQHGFATRKLTSLEEDMRLVLEEARPFLAKSAQLVQSAQMQAQQQMQAQASVAQSAQQARHGELEIKNPAEWFYAADGRVWKSLFQFREELPFVSEGTFSHHVTPSRNDFANWMRGVFKNEGLARQLESSKTKEDLVKLLSSHSN